MGKGAVSYIITTAVYTELGRQGDSAAEEEQGIEDVQRERNWRVGHQAGECASDEEE